MFIDSIFNELGIDRVIHAGGTKTWYGGTSLSPAVLNAMNQSTRVFCNIEDLNKSIGRYIADTTKSEAGMVTSGCSSSLVMAATACLLKKIGLEKHLPNKNYFSYNVAVQRIHFGDYTYLLKMPCLSINEYGTVNHTSISDLMECIDNNTVATYLLFGPGINQSSVSIEVIKKETEKYNIPLIVNAAAMIPPIDNLSFFINQGADLVCMSGGKALGGPQNTGLLFGRKDLVELARRNFNPNQSIGRTMKVSKESMIGLYIALKEYVKYGDTRMYKKCLEVSKKIYQALKISK
ncbi:MAG: hypothetical protein KDC90_08080, partial [Ignavibacteriae bacterium]|nr:hypothetical protein [Ignavibacteriota bacterium]